MLVWQLLSKEESNCENIKYYQILYERDGMSGVHHRVSALNSASAKNISDHVEFDAGYWVMLTAYNNQEMDSSSRRMRVVTPAAREFPPVSLLVTVCLFEIKSCAESVTFRQLMSIFDCALLLAV